MGNKQIQVLEHQFRNIVQKDKNIRNAFLLIHSEKHGIEVNLAEGKTGTTRASTNQPFYIANAGKMFTAILVAKLVEEGKLSFTDYIADYLPKEITENLHIYDGTNYSKQIQIMHLLHHTSGLPDFFEDQPKRGKPLVEQVFQKPDTVWKPIETIQWSKERLKPHFPPGEGFHYSDTGYHLLGLIIERVTSLAYHVALKQYIFQPLKMYQSCLLQYSSPIKESAHSVADVYRKEENVGMYRSLSMDYAAGGIVAPVRDLLKFMKAVVNHEVISKNTLEKMQNWLKFATGIDYGYGMMKFKPNPIILPRKYEMWGNAGITGSFMFYHPVLDTYIIGGVNQFFYHKKAIKLVFQVVDELFRKTRKSSAFESKIRTYV